MVEEQIIAPVALNTFSNLFIVGVHYTYHHMPCLVAVVDCTHVGSAIASFEFGNNFPGARIPQTKYNDNNNVIMFVVVVVVNNNNNF